MIQAFSFQDATAALTGRYATDTAYADKLNALIEQYGLTSYDEPLVTDEVQETTEQDNQTQQNNQPTKTVNPN